MSTIPHRTSAEILAEHVYGSLSLDDPPLINVGAAFPVTPDGENMTTFELDCRDWGLVYGCAYGIARGEDPYESADSVAQRALEAAKIAWARWGDDAGILTEAGFWKSRAGDRPTSMAEAIKPVMDAFDRAYVAAGYKPAMSDELATALHKLAIESR